MAGKPNVVLIHSVLLFVLAAFTVSQALKLSELSSNFESVPTTSNIEGMIDQQVALRTDLDKLEAKEFVSAAQYENDRLEFRQQIETLVRPLPSVGYQQLREDLSSLALEVDRAKQSLADLQKTAVSRPIPPAQASMGKPKPGRPKSIAPPFTVIGLEWRGGESFLAVSPVQANRLADISLLRGGDAYSGWQLSALEAGQAQFVLPDGSRHVLNIR